ncbi:hypothetical protein LOK49_LG07G02277 [Camellia lanceoleosa]|uniref:Uncharacterized protein n=1 Tax=Camellia lanceoleosa TaxID=1840588 RepID=A0ACC0GZI1_9ERIC|nr:hypothetical protein LOK49_LG07G02277 [Camellia lanceoleosa]
MTTTEPLIFPTKSSDGAPVESLNLDVHCSNGAVNHALVGVCGGGNEVDDMAKEVEEDADDLASSNAVAPGYGLELTCKGVQVDTIVEET